MSTEHRRNHYCRIMAAKTFLILKAPSFKLSRLNICLKGVQLSNKTVKNINCAILNHFLISTETFTCHCVTKPNLVNCYIISKPYPTTHKHKHKALFQLNHPLVERIIVCTIMTAGYISLLTSALLFEFCDDQHISIHLVIFFFPLSMLCQSGRLLWRLGFASMV